MAPDTTHAQAQTQDLDTTREGRITAIAGDRGRPGRLTDFASRLDKQDAYRVVDDLADWTPWVRIGRWLELPNPPAPTAGVFTMRVHGSAIVFVGAVGERRLEGRATGLAGVLGEFASGRGTLSGFGEAILDRALGDPEFIAKQLRITDMNGARNTRTWSLDAAGWYQADVRWVSTRDWQAAEQLNRALTVLLKRHGLWRRRDDGSTMVRT